MFATSRCCRVAVLIGVSVLIAGPGPAIAQVRTIWFSPQQAIISAPGAVVAPGAVAPGIRITGPVGGLLSGLVSFPLVLPDDMVIDAVTICYDDLIVGSAATVMGNPRITSMLVPGSSSTMFSETVTYPQGTTCRRIAMTAQVPVSGAMTLEVGVFGLPTPGLSGMIDFGGIGVEMVPAVARVGSSSSEARSAPQVRNAPNPFSRVTTIEYQLLQDGPAELAIYDVEGRLIRDLVKSDVPLGTHRVEWDGKNAMGEEVTPGVYFCQVKTDGLSDVRRLVIAR